MLKAKIARIATYCAIVAIMISLFTGVLPASGETVTDQSAVSHLEALYKAYIAKYKGQTTQTGLKRVADQAFVIDGDSFAAEKDAGYTATLTSYTFQPVDGAKDKDGVIVPSKDGYVKVKAVVYKNGTQVDTIEFLERIPANMKELTYEKISEESEFTIKDGVLEAYNGDADKIVIPEGVKSIPYQWYKPQDKSRVKIIIFPNSLETLGNATCQDMSNLMAVYMGDKVTSLGTHSFYNCISLRYIRLSESLTVLPLQAFRNTKTLRNLYIPAGINEFGSDCFKGSAIREVIVTNNSWTVASWDHFKEYANIYAVPSDINPQIKEDVEAERKDDMNNIPTRVITILSTSTTVTGGGWVWTLGIGMVNGELGKDDVTGRYTYVYAREGSDLDTFAKSNASFNGKYSTLDQFHIDTVLEVRRLMSRVQVDVDKVVNDTIKNYNFVNKTRKEDLQAALQFALAGTDYTVTINDWYMLRSVGGCKDQDGIIFDGYRGYVYANINITRDDFDKTYPLYAEIDPEITEYTFESVAKADTFTLDDDGATLIGKVKDRDGEYFQLSKDGTTLLGYSGEAEKIIIPEGVKKLDPSWWLDTDLEKVRCLILPDSLVELPDQFAVPFSRNIEVIIMGDNVHKADGWHTFWKCYRLKHLRLSENLENLTEEALFQTLSLIDLRLPNKLKVIGKGAFHLSALRDIIVPASVENIDQEAFAWPLRDLKYLTPDIRTQGNPVDPEIAEELNPFLHSHIKLSNSSFIPRVITILSKNAKYVSAKNFWSSDLSWIPVTVRYISGSTTEQFINGDAPKGPAFTYQVLDMSENEVEASIMDALARVPLNADTTEEDVLNFVKSFIHSSKVKDDMKVNDFELVKPTEELDGVASGTVTVSKNDGSDITIMFERTIRYITPVTLDYGEETDPSEEPQNPTEPGGPATEPSEQEEPKGSDDTESPKTGIVSSVAIALVFSIAGVLALIINKKKKLAR